MKRILFLSLLAGSVAFGQDYFRDHADTIIISQDYGLMFETHEEPIGTVIDLRETEEERQQNFSELFLALYDVYADKCYEDSTMYHWAGGPRMPAQPIRIDSLGRKHLDLQQSVSVPAVLMYYEKWEHRQPTLPGFIEWLRQRKELQ